MLVVRCKDKLFPPFLLAIVVGIVKKMSSVRVSSVSRGTDFYVYMVKAGYGFQQGIDIPPKLKRQILVIGRIDATGEGTGFHGIVFGYRKEKINFIAK